MAGRPGPGEPDDDPRTARLKEIERGVEDRLRVMAEAGELSGLPGEGRPIPADDGLAGERWAAVHAMRNAGVVPEWSELRREIDARADALVARARRHLRWLRARQEHLVGLPAERILEAAKATREADAGVRHEMAEAIAELNGLVRRYDLIVPVDGLRIAPLTLERVLARAEGADES